MTSGVEPVQTLDTSINFVLYKLTIASVPLILNEMKDPGYEATLSPLSSTCKHTLEQCSLSIALSSWRTESAAQRTNSVSSKTALCFLLL